MPDEIVIKVTTAADLAAAKEAKSTLDALAASNKVAEAAAKSRADSSMTISAAEVQASAKVTTSLEEQLVAWRALKAEREAAIKITDASNYSGDGQSSIPQTIKMTGSGLATQAPALNETAEAAKTAEAEVAAFNITTEAEYLAIKKASDAITAKLPVLKAAGVETVALEATQAKYAAALSGTNAVQIQNNIATRAAELEKAKLAEASLAAAAGERAHTASIHGNTVAMREAGSLTREVFTGQYSRVPGTLGYLLSSLGIGGAAVTGGITAAMVGFFALEGVFRKIKESTQEADKAFEDFLGQAVHVPGMVGDLNGVREMNNQIAESAFKFHLELQRIMTETNVLQTQMGNTTAAISAQFNELTAREKGEIDLLNARIQLENKLGLISDDQAAKEHAQVAIKAARQKMDAENAKDAADIAAKQKEIDDATSKKDSAEADAKAANQKVGDAQTAIDNNKTNQGKIDKAITDSESGTDEFAEKLKKEVKYVPGKETKSAAEADYIQKLADSMRQISGKIFAPDEHAEISPDILNNIDAIQAAILKHQGEPAQQAFFNALTDLYKTHPEAEAALSQMVEKNPITGIVGNAQTAMDLMTALEQHRNTVQSEGTNQRLRTQYRNEEHGLTDAKSAAEAIAKPLNDAATKIANILTPDNLNALQQQKIAFANNQTLRQEELSATVKQLIQQQVLAVIQDAMKSDGGLSGIINAGTGAKFDLNQMRIAGLHPETAESEYEAAAKLRDERGIPIQQITQDSYDRVLRDKRQQAPLDSLLRGLAGSDLGAQIQKIINSSDNLTIAGPIPGVPPAMDTSSLAGEQTRIAAAIKDFQRRNTIGQADNPGISPDEGTPTSSKSTPGANADAMSTLFSAYQGSTASALQSSSGADLEKLRGIYRVFNPNATGAITDEQISEFLNKSNPDAVHTALGNYYKRSGFGQTAHTQGTIQDGGQGAMDATHQAVKAVNTTVSNIHTTMNTITPLLKSLNASLLSTNGVVADLKKQVEQNRIK